MSGATHNPSLSSVSHFANTSDTHKTDVVTILKQVKPDTLVEKSFPLTWSTIVTSIQFQELAQVHFELRNITCIKPDVAD